MTRSDAGSRSTGRDRTRSRSEERKHRLHHRLNFLKETRRSSSAPQSGILMHCCGMVLTSIRLRKNGASC